MDLAVEALINDHHREREGHSPPLLTVNPLIHSDNDNENESISLSSYQRANFAACLIKSHSSRALNDRMFSWDFCFTPISSHVVC